MYPEVEEEMMKIYERSGSKAKFASQLSKRIEYLEDKKEKCVFHCEWFENYTGEEWLYCLKIKGTFHNFRMYFVFYNNKAVFLHAFVEKKKSDIKKAKKVVEARYEMLKNNLE